MSLIGLPVDLIRYILIFVPDGSRGPLRYIRRFNQYIDKKNLPNAALFACDIGRLELAQWTIVNGCPYPVLIYNIAAARGHLHILKWLKQYADEHGYFKSYEPVAHHVDSEEEADELQRALDNNKYAYFKEHRPVVTDSRMDAINQRY